MDRKIILLCNILSISNKVTLKLLKVYENYEELVKNVQSLKEIQGLNIRTANKIIKNINLDIKSYLNKVENQGIKIVFYTDENYPYNLNYIDDFPLMLYYLGELKEEDKLGISIVGSRKCTSYGAWACKELVTGLSSYKIPIISGLAYGIDKIAHQTSLDNDNRTIAVVGNGLDIVYPANHRQLYKSILDNGAIISEYSLGIKPLPYNFPYRNRIISGIGQGVAVIEAQGKSGTLITANYAAEQGKEVFALPGNINSFYSKGTNALIRDGAKIITELEDILEEINCPKILNTENQKIEFTDEIEGQIYSILKNSPCTCDIISHQLNIPIDKINVNLTKLEIKGYIREELGGIFYPVLRKDE